MPNKFSSPVLLLAVLISIQLNAQNIDYLTDSLKTKMEWYGISKKPSLLFVHFDKNIYTSNEQVWFTAYILSTRVAIENHHTLLVSLIRDDDSTILSNYKFVIKDFFSFGNMKLPDSLLPGNYSLHAYTNVLIDGKPTGSFIQPITIKSEIDKQFSASLKLLQNSNLNNDSVALSFKAFAKDLLTLPSYTSISYSLGNGKIRFSGNLKTDIYGGANFKIPKKLLDINNNRLRVKAVFQNETTLLDMLLPVNNNNPSIKFFPEGGSLSVGNQSVVGWEVRDAFGEPLQISGILFRNTQPVDTIETDTYGMGRFDLKPETNVKYHIKLLKKSQIEVEYPLPEASGNPFSLTVEKAVCCDTLIFYAKSISSGMYYAIVHNYTESFINFPINLTKSSEKIFQVLLNGVPKGVQAITILDSLGRPVAERLFFAHFDKRTEVIIKTDLKEYSQRQKVSMDLQLKDASGLPVNGLVSIACVQNNRIDPKKFIDIETYTNLTSELESIPFKKDPLLSDYNNNIFMEEVLLIKGWRRYTWLDLLKTKSVDTFHTMTSLSFKGFVSRNTKKLKKPILITRLSDQGIETFYTDSTGNFEIERTKLITTSGNKIFFYIPFKDKDDYQITLKDPYSELSKSLVTGLAFQSFDPGNTERNSETLVLKKGEKAEMLKEVIVSAGKKDGSIYYSKNDCGDYVCEYNVLNCPNHPFGGTIPEKGQFYLSPKGGLVAYAGCLPKKKLTFLEGIYETKEFYQPDYSTLNPAEQVFSSTLYWNYSAKVDKNNPQNFTFYTSDITGKFKIIVQGVTNLGLVHGEYMINVH